MTREKANQGMRQPQLGGISSRFDIQRFGLVCKHERSWRLSPEHPWRCAICYPPVVPGVEFSESRRR